MLKLDYPVFIDHLYAINRKVTNAIEKALDNDHYDELVRLAGIQEGLRLVIDIAREQSVRSPQAHYTPVLPAEVATLLKDG